MVYNIFFLSSKYLNGTPDLTLFMAKSILNFHFDYLNPSPRWSPSSWLFRKTESQVSSCCTRGGLSGWSGWQSCSVWSGFLIDIWSSLIRFSYWYLIMFDQVFILIFGHFWSGAHLIKGFSIGMPRGTNFCIFFKFCSKSRWPSSFWTFDSKFFWRTLSNLRKGLLQQNRPSSVETLSNIP